MAAPTTPCRRRIHPLAGAVVAALAWAGSAAAQPPFPEAPESPEKPEIERPKVGVIDLRGDQESGAMAKVLGDAIVRRPELQYVVDVRVSDALVGPVDDLDAQRIAAARGYLDKAREQLANFQLALAIVRAREGRDQLLEARPSADATALLAELVFTEGQAQLADQERSRARTAFALVHALTPGRTLDPNSYLRELVDAFAAAATPAAGSGTIEIATNGAVWLDGHAQGTDAQTLRVAPGAHVVIASGPDLLPSGRLVEVVTGQTVRIDLKLRDAPERVKATRARQALMQAPDPTARAGAMQQIAALLHLTDAVLVTSDARGSPAVQLWRNRAPGFQEIKPVTRILPPEEADRVIKPLVPKQPEPVDKGGPVIPFTPPETPKEWYQKRWVQAGLVGGAIAVIAGIVWARDAIGADSRPVGDIFPPGSTGRE